LGDEEGDPKAQAQEVGDHKKLKKKGKPSKQEYWDSTIGGPRKKKRFK